MAFCLLVLPVVMLTQHTMASLRSGIEGSGSIIGDAGGYAKTTSIMFDINTISESMSITTSTTAPYSMNYTEAGALKSVSTTGTKVPSNTMPSLTGTVLSTGSRHMSITAESKSETLTSSVNNSFTINSVSLETVSISSLVERSTTPRSVTSRDSTSSNTRTQGSRHTEHTRNASAVLNTITTHRPTTDQGTTRHRLALPLFYIVIIASVGATVALALVVLLCYIICLRQHNKKKIRVRRNSSQRRCLYDLEDSGSHSTTDGHELSITNKTEVVLRNGSVSGSRSSSLDKRSSRLGLKWKSNVKPTHTHSPSLNSSTFQPHQQLYLPHIQVQVHVGGQVTAGSRVNSYCKLNAN